MSAADEVAAVLDRLAGTAPGLARRVRREHPLGPLTTYRVGGAARAFVEVDAPEELVAVGRAVGPGGPAVLVVGRGSNLLVADAGFDGLAVQLGEGLAGVAVEGCTVRAGGAASLPVVARRTASAGLAGFVWAVGVPGSIGGAVRMNAGGHGSDMAAVLRRVRVVGLRGGEDASVDAADLGLGYRRSSLDASQVVVEAELELEAGDPVELEAALAEIVRWRRAHQPGGANAGSVFTNPEGDSAGRLIDTAGCKGLRIGAAEVSVKHANFIQADTAGSADDVLALMAEVRRRVAERHGIWLVAETRVVGADPEMVAAAGVAP